MENLKEKREDHIYLDYMIPIGFDLSAHIVNGVATSVKIRFGGRGEWTDLTPLFAEPYVLEDFIRFLKEVISRES